MTKRYNCLTTKKLDAVYKMILKHTETNNLEVKEQKGMNISINIKTGLGHFVNCQYKVYY